MASRIGTHPKRHRGADKILRPVHPNAGIEAAYRKKLQDLVDEMHRSFDYWLTASYRKNEPAMAQDATPAAELQKAVDKLAKQWRDRFDKGSQALARYFSVQAFRRSDAALMKILKDAGFTVQFRMTPGMRDVMRATLEQNVQLITSIPEQYLTQVQGAVMRSVQAGRDLGSLAKEFEHNYGVSKRRAAFIAQSQNNLATASMTKVRQIEVGIDEAVWLHSHGGREPRPTHVANSGKRYKISEGWFDPNPKVRRNIWPGELPRCRCVSKAVVKGFS